MPALAGVRDGWKNKRGDAPAGAAGRLPRTTCRPPARISFSASRKYAGGLGHLAAHLLGVLLPALLDLFLEQLLEVPVAHALLPLGRMVDDDVGDQRAGQPPGLGGGVLREEGIGRTAPWSRRRGSGTSRRRGGGGPPGRGAAGAVEGAADGGATGGSGDIGRWRPPEPPASGRSRTVPARRVAPSASTQAVRPAGAKPKARMPVPEEVPERWETPSPAGVSGPAEPEAASAQAGPQAAGGGTLAAGGSADRRRASVG